MWSLISLEGIVCALNSLVLSQVIFSPFFFFLGKNVIFSYNFQSLYTYLFFLSLDLVWIYIDIVTFNKENVNGFWNTTPVLHEDQDKWQVQFFLSWFAIFSIRWYNFWARLDMGLYVAVFLDFVQFSISRFRIRWASKNYRVKSPRNCLAPFSHVSWFCHSSIILLLVQRLFICYKYSLVTSIG